jgi:hypothetical protein
MQALGLQIDKPFLRAAVVQKGRSGLKIRLLKSSLLAEPANVKQLYTPKFKGRLASGLSSKNLMVRHMELHIGDTRHIETALIFQYEGMNHLNPAEILAVPHSIKKSTGKVDALLFTASRESLKAHIEEFKKIHANLDCVSSNALALIQYIRWKAPALSDAFLVDLGSSEWTSVLMEKGEMKKAHSLGSGIEDLLLAFWEDRKKILLPKEVEGVAKQIDLHQIKSNLNPYLSSKLNEMRQELAKVIYSFHRTSNRLPIIFTGHIDAFGHLKEFLSESFKDAIAGERNDALHLEEQKYAIPIGLAIEQMDRPLQLLQQEFFPKKNWRRAGFYAVTLLSFSICLSCLLLFVGLRIIEGRKRELAQSVQKLMEIWDPHSKIARLEQWAAAVETHHKEYPYILQSPRVAEVLSWISSHPLLAECKAESDSFDIRDIRYRLVEYPKIGSSQTRYRAKVEIQFGVTSAMNARRFHESLLQGDKMVDPAEVSWEALNDGYRAAFFLKNPKSPYVP